MFDRLYPVTFAWEFTLNEFNPVPDNGMSRVSYAVMLYKFWANVISTRNSYTWPEIINEYFLYSEMRTLKNWLKRFRHFKFDKWNMKLVMLEEHKKKLAKVHAFMLGKRSMPEPCMITDADHGLWDSKRVTGKVCAISPSAF